MRERWIVALAVLQFTIILVGVLFIGLTTYQAIEQIPQRTPYTPTYPYPRSTPWPPHNSNYTIQNIPVIHDDRQLYQGEYKPYVTTVNITAQDYHADLNSGTGSLHLKGTLNNTGGGVAYNIILHIVAMNAEGKVIDTNCEFVGMTAHMSMDIGQTFNYNGTALTNCTLTPTYIDKIDMQNQIPTLNSTYTQPP